MEDRMHGKREARVSHRIANRIGDGVRIGIALIAGIGLLVYLAFIAGILVLAGTGLHAVWRFIFG